MAEMDDRSAMEERVAPDRVAPDRVAPDRVASDRVAPEGYDGRFGDRFDDEISVPAIRDVLIGVVVTCVLAGAITWFLLKYFEDRYEETHEPISPAAVSVEEQRLPPGPLLQRAPEEELEAMRHEMDARVNGYGWVDEGRGLVHVPIDDGIDLLLERGTVASPASGAGAMESEPAADAQETELVTATEAAAQ